MFKAEFYRSVFRKLFFNLYFFYFYPNFKTAEMDWVKLSSFDNLFEAEMQKSILNSVGIDAVLVNARDSLFLIGNIDLYVKKQDKEKAENILLQFQGKTKINSFILEKPVELFREFLASKGIESELVRKEETEYILDNFELYVKNEDLEKVKPYLIADELDGWKLVKRCNKVRQTRFYVEFLEENGIDAMIVKKKDSDYHLEEVKIFVREEDFAKAKELTENLPGWKTVETYDKLHRAEIREELLGQHGIRAIIKPEGNIYKLLVEEKNFSKAQEVLNLHKNWVKIKTYDNIVLAEKDLEILLENGINASVISKKDEVFLLGEYYLYVDEDQVENALKILSQQANG